MTEPSIYERHAALQEAFDELNAHHQRVRDAYENQSKVIAQLRIATVAAALTPNAYEMLAGRTEATANDDMLTRLLNGALGLAGESGEVADQVKKFAFQGHPFNADKIVNELGDVLWYIALLCRVLGVPLETVMQRNLDKLGIRYGDAFDTIRSQTRVDEQQEGTNNA